MRKLLLLSLMGLATASFGQTELYHGMYQTDQIDIIDTTGGTYTVTSTLSATSDFSGTINGTFGLSLHPDTDEMYILYDAASGSCDRRLGILDVTTGDVTDIGNAGNMTDICFYDGVLYGNLGYDCESCALTEIDITDASSTIVLAASEFGYGHSLAWNLDNGMIYRLNDDDNNYFIIDPSDWSYTEFNPSSWLNANNYTNGSVFMNDSILVVSGGSNIMEMNINDESWIDVGATTSNDGHALAFGAYPLLIKVDGPTTFCSNEPSELSLNEAGTAYQWFLDGTPIAGETGPTHTPVASGTYTCDLDGTISLQKAITVLPAPDAAYTFAPDPVDLGVDITGTVDFTNTSTGGDTYNWNFGGGFESTSENPSFPFTSAGSYDVTLIVIDGTNGCSDTVTNTVTVINTTSVLELSSDFEFYPNPVEDVLNISMKNGGDTYKVKLIDMNGKVLNSAKMNEGDIQFDMSDVEAGIYMIRVYNKSEEQYFKVLKK